MKRRAFLRAMLATPAAYLVAKYGPPGGVERFRPIGPVRFYDEASRAPLALTREHDFTAQGTSNVENTARLLTEVIRAETRSRALPPKGGTT